MSNQKEGKLGTGSRERTSGGPLPPFNSLFLPPMAPTREVLAPGEESYLVASQSLTSEAHYNLTQSSQNLLPGTPYDPNNYALSPHNLLSGSSYNPNNYSLPPQNQMFTNPPSLSSQNLVPGASYNLRNYALPNDPPLPADSYNLRELNQAISSVPSQSTLLPSLFAAQPGIDTFQPDNLQATHDLPTSTRSSSPRSLSSLDINFVSFLLNDELDEDDQLDQRDEWNPSLLPIQGSQWNQTPQESHDVSGASSGGGWRSYMGGGGAITSERNLTSSDLPFNSGNLILQGACGVAGVQGGGFGEAPPLGIPQVPGGATGGPEVSPDLTRLLDPAGCSRKGYKHHHSRQFLPDGPEKEKRDRELVNEASRRRNKKKKVVHKELQELVNQLQQENISLQRRQQLLQLLQRKMTMLASRLNKPSQ